MIIQLSEKVHLCGHLDRKRNHEKWLSVKFHNYFMDMSGNVRTFADLKAEFCKAWYRHFHKYLDRLISSKSYMRPSVECMLQKEIRLLRDRWFGIIQQCANIAIICIVLTELFHQSFQKPEETWQFSLSISLANQIRPIITIPRKSPLLYAGGCLVIGRPNSGEYVPGSDIQKYFQHRRNNPHG